MLWRGMMWRNTGLVPRISGAVSAFQGRVKGVFPHAECINLTGQIWVTGLSDIEWAEFQLRYL